MRWLGLIAMLAVSGALMAQPPQVWQMQESGTTAGLRGIFSVDGTAAWASGTDGTVLRTTDGGAHWTKCAIPDEKTDGATLDFRGLQAWDTKTAIVMASGPGEKSRLYKTKDGCKSWKLILKNSDKEGFWDALYFDRGQTGWLLGDPVKEMFVLFSSNNKGKSWIRQRNKGLHADSKLQGAFAASNSLLFADGFDVLFGTGGKSGAMVYSGRQTVICVDECTPEESGAFGNLHKWNQYGIPLGRNAEASGVFAIGTRPDSPIAAGFPPRFRVFIAVGGDYTKPNDSNGTAAYSLDGGNHWTASTKPPHGYRSTVQWSEAEKAWFTAGTNGSDISRDDGKTWQPLDDGNWNALSLPFIVGPKGRIAKLNSAALPKP
ncbi:MAG: hypothetical protein KGN79_07610 [Acidobacteriota bacterium]|nr:hypothetical protein [Acidobacteriota bacterium]